MITALAARTAPTPSAARADALVEPSTVCPIFRDEDRTRTAGSARQFAPTLVDAIRDAAVERMCRRLEANRPTAPASPVA